MFTSNSNSCPGRCQFVQDPHQVDRYTCLPCGKVRYTSNDNALGPIFAVAAAVVLVGLVAASCAVEPASEEVVARAGEGRSERCFES